MQQRKREREYQRCTQGATPTARSIYRVSFSMRQQALPLRLLLFGEPGLLWEARWNLGESLATQGRGFRSQEGPLEAA